MNGFLLLAVGAVIAGTGIGCASRDTGGPEKAAASEAKQAADAMQKQDWDRAIAHCDIALRLDPADVDAWWMRGLSYLKKHQPDKAIADLTEAIRRDTRYAPAYRDRGHAYVEKKDFAKAVADFSEYLRLRPADAEVYQARGDAYLRQGDRAAARADFRKAREFKAGRK